MTDRDRAGGGTPPPRDHASGGRVLSRGGGSSPLPGTAAAEDPLPTPPARGSGSFDVATPAEPAKARVVWHDVECGAYAADLPLWEELADDVGAPVLDLGCGTGRVALHLARRGHEVTGLDADPALVAAFSERAEGLSARAVRGDAREFELEGECALAIAPMQLVQLFGGPAERRACLACVAAHLRPGGRAALAIAEEVLAGTNRGEDGSVAEPVVAPDTREVDGWVYSSLPLETEVAAGEVVVRRLRRAVSPAGELKESEDEVRLRELDAATLEREATRVGLRPAGRLRVPPTPEHVGSTVALLRRDA